MASIELGRAQQEPGSHSLAGRTIVITRARAQAGEFVTELEKYGARVMICPTIEITDPESYDDLDEAINHLYGYDWVIFTSTNGVDYFFRRLGTCGHKVGEMDALRVCAIGDATAERLRDLCVHIDVIPEEFRAEGVYATLERFVGGRDALRGLNFLLPRAAVGRDYLPRILEDVGARVDVIAAYRTVINEDLDRGRLAALLAGSADCISFTSSSTVKNLARLFDTEDLSQILEGIPVACIGHITAQTAVDFGLKVQIQPDQATIPSLARAIASYFANQTT